MPKLNEIEVDKFLRDSVAIEPTLLQEEYVRIPSDIAYWNERYSIALRALLTAKLKLDQTYAGLQITMREKLAAEGQKTTESMVQSHIELDASYHAARQTALEAEVEASRVKGVGYAVAAKREMIVSLGAHLRIELQHDPMIREQRRVSRLENEG